MGNIGRVWLIFPIIYGANAMVYIVLCKNSNAMRRVWSQGYTTFFMLNSAEHEICPVIVGIFIFISRENFILS